MSNGEQKAWEILSGLDPEDVSRNAGVLFDEKNHRYILRSFCEDFSLSPEEKLIKGISPEGEHFIKRYGYFFIHSALWYLVNAKDIPLAGRLVKPANLKGGELFFRGSHVLPLEGLAFKYCNDKDAFLEKGRALCGETLDHGDASIKLLPLPRIPVTIILWLKDEEFPERADLLFDSTCEMHLPLDIIWSAAMMSLLAMF